MKQKEYFLKKIYLNKPIKKTKISTNYSKF